MGRRNQGARLRWLDKRGCYYITWTENGRSRERSTGTTDRSEAEIIFAEFLSKYSRPNGRPPDPSDVLVTDVLTAYATERGPKVVDGARIGNAVVPLSEFFQGEMVADVTPNACVEYVMWRERAIGTVRRELGVLKAAINHAHKNRRILYPVHLQIPKSPPSNPRWLTRDEAAALLHAARQFPLAASYLPLFILIGIYTGRRKEAILSLHWDRVDFVSGRINFEIPGRQITIKKRGVVPIPPRLLGHLERAHGRDAEQSYVLNFRGRRIGDIKGSFTKACAAAGVEGVTPHTLRHTAATWLMQRGTDPWQAAGFLGMSVQVLLNVYGHHHPDYMKDAAGNIGRRQ